MRRTVLVVATLRPASHFLRMKCPLVATTIAEPPGPGEGCASMMDSPNQIHHALAVIGALWEACCGKGPRRPSCRIPKPLEHDTHNGSMQCMPVGGR